MNMMGFLVGFFYFAFAAVMGFSLAYSIRRDAQMKKYLSAEGTVLSAEMTSYKRRGKNGMCTYYEPIMEYTYTVGGRKYTSASITFGGGKYASVSREKIEKIVDHPAGGAITVFYNPDKPDESFIAKKASSGLVSTVIAALIAIFFGALGIWTMVMSILGITIEFPD